MNLDPVTLLILKILAVVVLVALNGFFVAAEFALVKIRDTQLDKLVLEGRWRAKVARRVLANLDRTLSAAQLGITLASLALGWVGEPVFAALLAPVMEWMQVESEAVRHTVAVIVGLVAERGSIARAWTRSASSRRSKSSGATASMMAVSS